MTSEERKKVLKLNLQLLSSAQDDYLAHLLDQAVALLTREGITDDGTTDYDMCVVDYAAFLFRKRSIGQITMPDFLKWEKRNLLLSQKAKESDSE